MTMYVGKRSIRVNAEDKVTGKAVYPDDIEFPDMVYAGVVRSSIPYGKVTDIDFEEAKKMKGVISIIDYSMIPGKKLMEWYLKISLCL